MNDLVNTAQRAVRIAHTGDTELGPLKLLPGTWANIQPQHRLEKRDGTKDAFRGAGTLDGTGQSPFDGRGWNIIALPFAQEGQFRNYRLLMNQYNEVLKFSKVDDNVPNRGISSDRPARNTPQRIAALDYEQAIAQIAAEDFANSGTAGPALLPIHHEPGLFLHMKEQTIDGFNIARLATIPHGNAANAIGKWSEETHVIDGPPTIGTLSAFPEGVTDDVATAAGNATGERDYLRPYNHFLQNPFKGVIGAAGFPGFGPENSNLLLQLGLPNNVVRTTILKMDTDDLEAGIVNIPFIERQADAAVMRSTFWIMELSDTDANGDPKLVMAYSQFIFLDFFDRVDGKPGLIRWPHVSINMMEKIEDIDSEADDLMVMSAEDI
ncbi:MAG: heme-binding protein [Pseudomonadota bacterium]